MDGLIVTSHTSAGARELSHDAKRVCGEGLTQAGGLRVFALITDAYGGHGGIAQYNRDLLEALCSAPGVSEVVAVPRVISRSIGQLPIKLRYVASAARNNSAYLAALTRNIRYAAGADLIYCAHINLAPLAWILGTALRKPVLLAVYGIDAWQPTGKWFTDWAALRLNNYIAISRYTKDRFLAWADVDADRIQLLPNAIHLERYGPGATSGATRERFGIRGSPVIMTLGRIVSEERAKGFDEVLNVMPSLASELPSITYVIAGDGDYRPRLEEKARCLGLADRVVFTGFVQEEHKSDLYRCADLYVMPSRGEGFGFVILEAMACGVPVIASSVDGSRDAVRDGALGEMVDPDDQNGLRNAIVAGLKRPRGVPAGLEYFCFDNFSDRLVRIVAAATGASKK